MSDDLLDTKTNFYYSSIIGVILCVAFVIALLYYAYQRQKMDVDNNVTNETWYVEDIDALLDEDPRTIRNVIKNSYLKMIATTIVLFSGIGIVAMIYIALKSGSLNGMTVSAYVLLGTAAAMLYFAIRMWESSTQLTQEIADIYPGSTYKAVKSIEQSLTGCLCLSAFYTLVSYLGYAGMHAKKPVGEGVYGGYINEKALASMRLRAIGTEPN